jgi:hypothetical protein
MQALPGNFLLLPHQADPDPDPDPDPDSAMPGATLAVGFHHSLSQ